MPYLGNEPTLIIQSIVAALNAVQLLAVGVPAGVHVVIAVVLVALGAVLNRKTVTPSA